jgi:hypothetical protein
VSTTSDPNDPRLKNIGPDGMQESYLVLSEEERARGFVRPVRRSYRHVGIAGPRFLLRDLTDEEATRYAGARYVKFEEYPTGEAAAGPFWTQERLDKVGRGCGVVTTMGQQIAETYARNPGFYGGTYCAGCSTHRSVGPDGEFVWEGTNERVGT